MNLTAEQLQQIVGGKLHQGPLKLSSGVAQPMHVVTDSRKVQHGDLFWALPGKRRHGTQFARQALNQGAAGVLIQAESSDIEPRGNQFCLQVDDSLKALWKLARWKRQQFAGQTIAVTGLVGKTTARDMLAAVLRTQRTGITSPANFNNRIGVPLSMLGMDAGQEFAVLELTGKTTGDIASLTQLCQPEIAVIPQIGDRHLLGSTHLASSSHQPSTTTSMYGELLQHLPAGGHAILNGDDPSLRRMARSCRASITWVGRGGENDLVASQVRYHNGRLQFLLANQHFEVKIWGRHHLSSILCTIGLGINLGWTVQELSDCLSSFEASSPHCEVSRWAGTTFISDCFNASPTALQASLELLREIDAPGKRIAVCGDMQAQGNDSNLLHYQLGSKVVTSCGADLLLALGNHRYQIIAGANQAGMPSAQTIACRDAEDVITLLRQTIRPGDAVLIKGSRALAMERITQVLQWQPMLRVA